jgi:hypothetical protein
MTQEIYIRENGEYLKNNPTWHIEDSPWKAKQIIKILARNPLTLKTVVEVGCGAGEILNQLHSSMPKDVSFVGYDISNDAINLARKREKERLEFKCEDFLESDQEVDLMLMMDVFEHVDNYLEFLKSCRHKAKYAIFHIPLDISVQGVLRDKIMAARRNVGHLHYFTKDTAIASLEDTGYKIIDFFYTKGSLDLPTETLKSKLAVLPRKFMYSIDKDLAVKLLGGFSLLVLTEQN